MILSAMLSYLDNIDATSLQWIDDTLAQEPELAGRSLPSGSVSILTGVLATAGRLNRTGCATVLRRLERYELIQLPEAKTIPCNDPVRKQSLAPYPARTELRCRLSELGNIERVHYAFGEKP